MLTLLSLVIMPHVCLFKLRFGLEIDIESHLMHNDH